MLSALAVGRKLTDNLCYSKKEKKQWVAARDWALILKKGEYTGPLSHND
jgi:hypothetical protein